VSDDHEHDEHGNCILPGESAVRADVLSWQLQPLDLIGVALHGLSVTFSLWSREFQAAAEYRRQVNYARQVNAARAAERAAMARDLEQIVDGS